MIGQRLARGVLRLMGWTLVDDVPERPPKFVTIGAPHTTNWDLPIAILMFVGLGMKRNWVGKHTLFRPPLGWLMRALGGVPLDRSKRHNFVDQVVAAFDGAEEMVIALAPEGTRSHTSHWKTGFYYIAVGANVPIVLAFIDYPTKRIGLGSILYPTGDLDADIQFIRDFYADKRGKRPENEGEIRARPPRENQAASGAEAGP